MVEDLARGTSTHAAYTEFIGGTLRDYISLIKLRVVSMLVFVAIASAVAAGGRGISPYIIMWVGVAGLLASAGSSAVNCYLDRDIDQTMKRTRLRALPMGRIEPAHNALIFGAWLLAFSLLVAYSALNALAATFILLGALIYIGVYTIWLKRRSTWSIIIGGLAGCMPVLTGWTAVTNSVTWEPVLLALLVLLWIPAHNWSFSVVARNDYESVKVPILPMIIGVRKTLKLVFLSSVLLVGFTLSLYGLGFTGPIYLIFSLAGAVPVLTKGYTLLRDDSQAAVWSMYKRLSIYLSLVFLGLIFDALLIR